MLGQISNANALKFSKQQNAMISIFLMIKARMMMTDMLMMMMRTCFTVSKSSAKESGGVADKSKKVEDHRCH